MRKIVLILLFTIIILPALSFAEDNIIKGPVPDKLPPTEKCPACHNIPLVYNELLQSAHKDLKCYDCHLPGGIQKGKYKPEDCNFYRLGYHHKNGEWIETSRNEVCLRCHNDKEVMNSNVECWSCHMPKGGIDKLVIVKDRKLPPKGDNIKRLKKLIHTSHNFRIHEE